MDEDREVREAEYMQTLRQCYMIMRMTIPMDIDACIRAAKRSQTLAPFFDPTAFIANADKLREDIQCMEAVRVLQQAAQKAWPELA